MARGGGVLWWAMGLWWGVVEGVGNLKNVLLYARLKPQTKVQV